MAQSGSEQDLPRKDEIPNIVGQTTTNADSQIVSAGMVVGTKSTTNTDNSSLENTVASQVDTAGDIKLLGHSMDYTYYLSLIHISEPTRPY